MLNDLARDQHVASGQLGSALSFKNPSLRHMQGLTATRWVAGRESLGPWQLAPGTGIP